ncbi:MAG: cell division protein FtsA [Muribaculaceae bacterium]|nr:cell division protein FtsA [Muribaculaceae bacterium]MDE6345670.1 cell division protein FtsA [Muribaculaceae bacterium]
MDDKYIVAIEIGSSKIRGALASVDPTGALNILAVQEERVADSVRYGHVKNVEEVSTKVDSICRKLENARAIQPRKIAGVYVGLSGCTIGASLASETSRFDSDTEIDTSSIERLKDLITTVGNGDKEIYELLPYEFIVDNESTLNPVGRIGRSIKGTFSVIEGMPAIKNNLNRVFPERLNLQVNGYIVSALAQANMVLTPDEKQLGCMFVDFGCETTSIIIYKKGVLRYMVTLPMGSRNITRDLVSLNHLEEHAESIKRSIGIVSPSDGPARHAGQHTIEQPELNSYISARAGEIVANVIANIEYAGLTPADLPSGIVTTGGGARLKGLSDMIASQSNMKVRMGTTPRNIRISDTSISADEISDVVALLIAAAERNPADCLSPVARMEFPESGGNNNTTATGSTGYSAHDAGDYDDGKIRIGVDDDEDDIDEDDYIDRKFKGNGRRKGARKTQENVSNPNPIIARIKEKFTKMFRDDEADRFDDEE